MRLLCLALSATLLAAPALAGDDDAPAGLMAKGNKHDLPEVVLSVGEPLGGPWTLSSGGYYEVKITSDGSDEMGLSGGDFFRAIWVDEVVIEGLEVRPMGLHSIEFDQPGTMEIGFVAVKPGRYVLEVPGARGEDQKLAITID